MRAINFLSVIFLFILRYSNGIPTEIDGIIIEDVVEIQQHQQQTLETVNENQIENSPPLPELTNSNYSENVISDELVMGIQPPTEVIFYDFAEIQRNFTIQLNTLTNFIKEGRCRNFYFDIGTNIGMQLRKLYEPQYYPESPVLPYYDKFFGNLIIDNKTRTDTCAVGFEPGPLHVQRLLQMQKAYQDAGFPLVIFTSTAVFTEDGEMTLFEDRFSPDAAHQHSSSLYPIDERMIPHKVLSIDIAKFLRNIFNLWDKYHYSPLSSSAFFPPVAPYDLEKEKKYFYHPLISRVMVKIDIEGAEYEILPHLIGHGIWCHFHVVLQEFHPQYLADPSIHTQLLNFLQFISSKLKNCHLKIVEMDDETYGRGYDEQPYPPPAEKVPSIFTELEDLADKNQTLSIQTM